MRRHTGLIATGLTIAILLVLSSQALASKAKYLVPLYRISELGPPIQYDPVSVGNADITLDITATERSFIVQVTLRCDGGLPNTRYRSGFGVEVGSRWVVTRSSLVTDDKGAGSATLTMEIPAEVTKPYTVAVGLAARGSYIISKRVILMNAP